MAAWDRREVLGGGARLAAAMAALNAPPAGAAETTAGESRKASPGERVTVAVVGCRGRGRGLAEGFAGLPEAQVAYLCDVDDGVLPPVMAEVSRRQGREPRAVRDFRQVLDDRGVDAVVIATPDHWHALASILAMQAGKDVYVEKPMTHNVREGRAMIRAARETGRVVQCGTQSRSGAHFQSAVEYLRSGKLGRVMVAKAVNSQRRSNIGKKQDAPVPAGVDYDLWLGPAPKRPFNPNRFHYNWHWHWDYGTGDMGNDGVHQLDVARWGLGVEAPVAVSCSGGKLFFDDDQETPDTQHVTLEYPGRMIVFEQRIWAPYHEHGFENGNIFYGENGYMLVGASGWKVFGPRDEPGPTSGGSERDRAHLVDFITAVKSRGRTRCGVEEGHFSAMLCHLGNIAYRTGRRLRFDPASESFLDDAEAQRLLGRKYRKPWSLPFSRS